MKMFRRLAALAVAVAMVLVMLPAAVGAGELPEDVKGTKYEDAASLLCALDIMVGDGANFNPDNNVTRAEFAKILVTAMGLEDSIAVFQAKGVFSDVATTEWYAPYVELAAQKKAINGYGDGKFGPNDNVTGYQAIKMGCFASGHNSIISDPIEGYPTEYYNVAEEYDFLKGITGVNFSEPMTRGQVAILIANIMKADMFKYVGTAGDSGAMYESVPGVNLLSEKHDVFRFDGLVTANDKTGLFGVSTLLPGEVQVEKGADVCVFKVGATDIGDKVGSFVKVYYNYDEDSNIQTVVSYDASSNKNTRIELDYEDIELAESTDSVIKYYKDKENSSKLTKIEMNATPSIIWNGSASSYKSVTEAIGDADEMQAVVEFLDYDGDDRFDVVSIVAYETFVVSRIDGDNFVITDEVGDWSTGEKKKSSITMDVEDDTVFVTIKDADGADVDFESIEKGNTLSIAASEDGKVFDVKLSTEVVEGTVDSIGYVDGKMVVNVAGEDYMLTPNYFGYITEGNAAAAIADLKIKIGKDYKFNLDIFGNIAWSDSAGGSGAAVGDLGFITFYDEAGGADNSVGIKMYSNGSVNVYNTADTVRIDGGKYKGVAAIKTAMDEAIEAYIPGKGYYGDSKWAGIPVLFQLDAEGKVKYIDTPTVGEDEDKYTLQKTRNATEDTISQKTYVSALKGFGSAFPLDSALNVIQLPSVKSDINVAAKYSTSATFSNENKYYVQLFTTDPESYKSNIIVVARGASGTSTTFTTNFRSGLTEASTKFASSGVKDTKFIVVKDYYRTVAGDDEEETIIIEGFENGAEVTYTVDPEYFATGYIYKTFAEHIQGGATLSESRTTTDPLIEGDVIKVATNKESGLATFVGPVFMIEERSYYNPQEGGLLDASTRYQATDIAVISEIDGTAGVASHILLPGSTVTSGLIKFDETGRFVRTSDEKAYLKWTEEDGYIGQYGQLITNLSSFKITKYEADKSSGNKVSKGTIDDIVTLEDATTKTPPSIVIMQFRSGSAWGMHIINL